jgi:hypothetical protein
VATLLASARRLYGWTNVRELVGFIEGKRPELPPNTPAEMASLAKKYRGLYASKCLDDRYGFVVHDMPDHLVMFRIRRILELFWHINEDHVALEAEAVASGRWRPNTPQSPISEASNDEQKLYESTEATEPCHLPGTVWSRKGFAYLPISSLKSRHVRVDHQSFMRASKAALFGSDKIADVNTELFLGFMFKSGGKESRRRDFKRQRGPGWVAGTSFVTDGVSLVFLYESLVQKRSAKGKGPLQPELVIPEGCRLVGDDPGRVNVHTTCEEVGEGKYLFRQLTRAEYYRESMFDANRLSSNRRERHHASAAMAALSATRRRTHLATEFIQYVRAIATHAEELKKGYACRAARKEAFRAYRFKTKTVDGFIQQHVSPDRKTVYYLGDGSFASHGRGERAVPTSSYGTRIRRAHPQVILSMTDERCTSKFCPVTHTELGHAWRSVVCSDGVTRFRKDRDVKLCNSEQFPMGSHSFLCASETLLQGLMPFHGTALDRDRMSAYSILLLGGKKDNERPVVFRRFRD